VSLAKNSCVFASPAGACQPLFPKSPTKLGHTREDLILKNTVRETGKTLNDTKKNKMSKRTEKQKRKGKPESN
jgi:hypothetical protein